MGCGEVKYREKQRNNDSGTMLAFFLNYNPVSLIVKYAYVIEIIDECPS